MSEEEKKKFDLKAHALEIVGLVVSLGFAVKLATDGRFLLTCVFLFLAIFCMGRIARGQSKKSN